jgi:hypothetical protein
MKKNLLLTVWIVLILLTISTALVSNLTIATTVATTIILVLSAIKFLGVSFYFMEMRSAHIFWKYSIFIYLFVVIGIIIFILK